MSKQILNQLLSKYSNRELYHIEYHGFYANHISHGIWALF